MISFETVPWKQISDSMFSDLDSASFDAPELMIRSETVLRKQILDCAFKDSKICFRGDVSERIMGSGASNGEK